MFKITGLEELGRDLEEAQRALAEIDGELGSVNFDPEDPESIEAAIASMEQLINEKVDGYSDNPLIGPLIEEMKENYRTSILDAASEARLGDDTDEQ